ncbi:MAG: hypothetical protein R3Y50_06120 [Rikenellaceae bacterium]
MSKEIDELRRKFKAQFGGDSDIVFQGVVTEVDETEFTCTVKRDDAVDYFDVRLRGLVNSGLQGFAFIPKVESTVLVCRIGKSNELFVCQFTEIDKMIFTDNDLILTVDTEKIELLKGENITINLDVDRLEFLNSSSIIKISADGLTLNRGDFGLKKTLEDLLTAIKALTVTTGTGPSGTPINVADFIKIEQDLQQYMEA